MSKAKIVYTSWKRAIPQIILVFSLVGFFYWLLPHSLILDNSSGRFHPGMLILSESMIYGSVCYILLSLSSRMLLQKYHRHGIVHFNNNNYDQAIAMFEKAKGFFERYAWLDKYRPILMLSPSVFSFREMAMMNMALSYFLKGDREKSRLAYEDLLKNYPNNELAKNTLAMMDNAVEE